MSHLISCCSSTPLPRSLCPSHCFTPPSLPSLRLCPILFLPLPGITLLCKTDFYTTVPFSTGAKEHTKLLKCQGTSVYFCGYLHKQTHSSSLYSDLTFFNKRPFHPSTKHCAISRFDMQLVSDYFTLNIFYFCEEKVTMVTSKFGTQ